MPQWLARAVLRLIRGWYDPAREQRREDRTARIIDHAARSRTRANEVLEAYQKAETAVHRK